MSSLVRTTSPSAAAPGRRGRAGCRPRSRMWSAVTGCVAVRRMRRRAVCGSLKTASPRMSVTSLRWSWSSMTSHSRRDDVVDPREQLLDRGPAVAAAPGAGVARPAACGEDDDGLAQRLARNGAGVDAHAADDATASRRSPTRLPSLAACTAARWPAGPLPRQSRSKCGHAGSAPGSPSSTSNDASVRTDDAGASTVSTARKSARQRSAVTSQRT